MMNLVQLHGRLTADPELRRTQSGKSVCSFTVAVDRETKEKETDFVSCVAWNATAEAITRYLSKGRQIIVYGRLQSRKWEDKQGNKRTEWAVVLNGFDFCDSIQHTDTAFPQQSKPVQFEEIEEEPDLPF